MIFHGGSFTTLDRSNPAATAVAGKTSSWLSAMTTESTP
jgi:hypothetical protein